MIPEFKELTPEEQKQVNKILWRAKFRLAFLGIKYMIGLFSANVASAFIGYKMFGSSLDTFTNFLYLCVFVNTIFMTFYLFSGLRKNNDIVLEQVSKVLDNKE